MLKWRIFMKKTVYQLIMAAFVLAAGCENIANGGNPFAPATYKAETAGTIPHGAVTIDPTSAAEGTTVTITVAPDPGYKLKAGSLKINDSAEGISPGQATDTWAFVMPASDVMVTAEFEELPDGSYSITIDSGNIANGSITASIGGTETRTATDGATVTLTIHPDTNYRLAETNGLTVTHTEGGVPVSVNGTGNTRTFTMPAAHVTVRAVFEELPPGQHSVSVPAGITTDKLSAAADETVTLTITPVSGYQYTVDSLTVTKSGGDTVEVASTGNENEFTFTMPDDDVTVTATFTAIEYNITISDPGNGNSVTSNPANTATEGSSVTLTASPAEGYQLASVTVTKEGGDVEVGGSGNTRTFVMPAGNVTVTAVFANYTISIPSFTGGSVSANPAGAAVGTQITLTITPSLGYELKGITVTKADNSSVTLEGSGNTRTFNMPASNVTVQATFALLSYTITLTQTGNGTVIISQPSTATVGNDQRTATAADIVKLSASPADGYQLAGVTVTKEGGGTVTVTDSEGLKVFAMPPSNVTIEIIFGSATTDYTITINTFEHGYIKATAQAQKSGITVVLEPHPESGYEAVPDSLTVTRTGGDTSVTVSQFAKSWSFTMPAFNVTVSGVQFKPKDYTIGIGTFEHGSIVAKIGDTPVSTATVVDTVTLTASPAYNYELQSVTVTKEGGGTIPVNGNGNTWTFAMPASNVTVSAVFGQNGTYAISIPASFEHGTVTANPTSTAQGDMITLTVNPEDYTYRLDSLTVVVTPGNQEVTITGEGNTRTFVMPASNVTVQAVFVLNIYSITITDIDTSKGSVTTTQNSAVAGSGIPITVTPKSGYQLKADSLTYTPTGGQPTKIKVNSNGKYTFILPESDVTVTAEFEAVPVLDAGLYEVGNSTAKTLSGDGTMLVKALAWIKASGSNNGNYLIVLDTYESTASAYIIGTYNQNNGNNSSTGNKKTLTITLSGKGDNVIITKSSGTGPLFTVYGFSNSDSPTLILENITLAGHPENTDPLLVVGGSTSTKKGCLKMEAGSQISGNGGGGVKIDTGGAFEMNGGTIKGNSAATGAAVLGVTGATFTKTGGAINGKTGDSSNTVTGDGGHVIVVGDKWRDSEAGVTVNTGDAGFWEN
jgi:hypothetical protein